MTKRLTVDIGGKTCPTSGLQSPRLSCYSLADQLPQGLIQRCTEVKGAWEAGRAELAALRVLLAAVHNSVERLSCFQFGHAQPIDSLAEEHASLLRCRRTAEQVLNSRLGAHRRIAEW